MRSFDGWNSRLKGPSDAKNQAQALALDWRDVLSGCSEAIGRLLNRENADILLRSDICPERALQPESALVRLTP